MTRKEDRLERSQERSEEYHRRRRTRLVLFTVAVILYVLVPLLWYGAIEFGLIHPIQTPEFKSAASVASLTLLAVIAFGLPEVLSRRLKLDEPKTSATTSPTNE